MLRIFAVLLFLLIFCFIELQVFVYLHLHYSRKEIFLINLTTNNLKVKVLELLIKDEYYEIDNICLNKIQI